MNSFAFTSKTLLFLLLFISTTAIFHSCLKEQNFIDTPLTPLNGTEPFTTPTSREIVVTSIFGLVVDENDNPVANSEVSLQTIRGIKTTTTDAQGNFLYSNVMVLKEGALLKVAQSGMFDAFRKMSLTKNSYNYTKIKLLDKNIIGSISAIEGGTLQDVSSSAKVQLNANSVRYENGEDYTGDVEVVMSWIDPTAEDLASRMVGDLSGIDKEGKPVALGTFGMLNVELLAGNGKELQLKEGISTTLSFPVPAEILNQAPPTIPLWSFDENLGTWVEEGTAALENGFYVGEVGHFSSWNVDIKTNPISVRGKVFVRMNEEDMEIPYLEVLVDIEGIAQVGGFLDDSGEFEFYNFPANTAFTLSILSVCGEILWEEELGPYASDTELETIVVQSADSNFVTVSGSGVDCDGNAVENGDVKFELNSIVSSFYPLQENGTFEFVANVCEATQGKLSIIDSKNKRTSFPVPIDFSDTPIALSPLAVCDELETYFYITINGFETDCSFSLEANVDDENNLSVKGWTYNYYSFAEILTENVVGVGIYPQTTLSLFDYDVFSEYEVLLEITEFGQNPGNVIQGKFYGNYPIVGEFKAIVQ
ncbi:MAG: astroprincin family protein [Chitinophagales bacterium]